MTTGKLFLYLPAECVASRAVFRSEGFKFLILDRKKSDDATSSEQQQQLSGCVM